MASKLLAKTTRSGHTGHNEVHNVVDIPVDNFVDRAGMKRSHPGLTWPKLSRPERPLFRRRGACFT